MSIEREVLGKKTLEWVYNFVGMGGGAFYVTGQMVRLTWRCWIWKDGVDVDVLWREKLKPEFVCPGSTTVCHHVSAHSIVELSIGGWILTLKDVVAYWCLSRGIRYLSANVDGVIENVCIPQRSPQKDDDRTPESFVIGCWWRGHETVLPTHPVWTV